jgi:hypothetical protein
MALPQKSLSFSQTKKAVRMPEGPSLLGILLPFVWSKLRFEIEGATSFHATSNEIFPWNAPKRPIPRKLTGNTLVLSTGTGDKKREYGERLWESKRPIRGNSSCKWFIYWRREPTICLRSAEIITSRGACCMPGYDCIRSEGRPPSFPTELWMLRQKVIDHRARRNGSPISNGCVDNKHLNWISCTKRWMC